MIKFSWVKKYSTEAYNGTHAFDTKVLPIKDIRYRDTVLVLYIVLYVTNHMHNK